MQHYVTYCADARMEEGMLRQFISLLEQAFPPYERRARGGQLALMDNSLYRIRTLQEDGKLLGFMAVWMLEGMIFLEHFAVDERFRSKEIGGRMLDELKEEAEKSEKQLILEAELPVDELTRRRIAFYRRHGMSVNEYLYYQMPLRACDGKTQMHLLSSSQLSEAQFRTAQQEIYRHVYGIIDFKTDNKLWE